MIKGKNIIIRPLRFEDCQKTINWRNDSELTYLVMSHPFPITEELEKEWYEKMLKNSSNKSIYFGIEDQANNELIGYVFLNNIEWISRNCMLGMLIGSKNVQGKGYGTEAMNLIIHYAFDTLNLRKISLHVIDKNERANKFYDKLGFEIEGVLKKHFYSKNTYHDIKILALLKAH